MQVVCANCQLSFQAPDGAAGLVCPICRSPLRPPEENGATAEAPTSGKSQVIDWGGGTLDELIALLSAPAWSARIEVLPPGATSPIGEVHVIAGGVSEAIHEGKSTHDALDKMRAASVKGSRFRVEPRLPNPNDGDLTFPGPDSGKLEERPLATLMRYCEDYVLTSGIEVWRGNESAKVEYRRGEIVGVTVGGIDAPERLAEVMQWSSGSYRLVTPRLSLPEIAPKTAAPPPAAVVVPRAAGAASKTIFGMPAIDPATIKAAVDKEKQKDKDKEKDKPRPSQPGMTAATGRATAPTSPAVVAPAPAPTPATPAASAAAAPPAAAAAASAAPTATTPPAAAPVAAAAPAAAPAAAATAAPRPSASASKTIFGVPTPATPPPAATSPAPAPAARATGEKAAAEKVVEKAQDKPVEKAPERPAEKPAAAAPERPSAPAPRPSQPSAPQKGTPAAPKPQPPAPRNNETPIWTYIGVGFVFGLALLGVYRLVMVFVH